MEKREKLYEGKAKIVYATDDPGKVIQYFKDDATAFNALKRGTILGKGVINNKMSATLFQRLAKAGIPTHYLATLSDREMLCRKLDIIKIEVISRNIVAGSLAKRTGLEEGCPSSRPSSSSTTNQIRSAIPCSRRITCACSSSLPQGSGVAQAHGPQDQCPPAALSSSGKG